MVVVSQAAGHTAGIEKVKYPILTYYIEPNE